MEQIINILGLASLSFLIASGATPIQLIKKKFNLIEKKEEYGTIRNLFIELINCSLCIGFWLGLIATHSIVIAALISIAAETISNHLSNKNLF